MLEATNDVSYISNGRELTRGSLIWEDGQGGERTFMLSIKPFSSWEIEKAFVIQIYKIQGFPPTTGDGEISPTTGNTTLTVSL